MKAKYLKRRITLINERPRNLLFTNIAKKLKEEKEQIKEEKIKEEGDLSPSEGLGDTITKIAEAVGANKITEAYTKVTGRDCGCNKRRTLLNQIMPYNKKG